ncbi:MAG TPA: hypothetical protein GXZ90_05245 [Clostridiales bacterium]|nr:hypothetical protein [Clostridiales bacterium]
MAAICKSKKKSCPFGCNSGAENHFDTLEEAQAFADKKNEEMYGLLTKDTSKLGHHGHHIMGLKEE